MSEEITSCQQQLLTSNFNIGAGVNYRGCRDAALASYLDLHKSFWRPVSSQVTRQLSSTRTLHSPHL